ncbi:acetyltransferase [Pollutimonas sp. M17]|uniref:acetyltransferase n=1 Tax=Pollutimonas sp. M17 TaxID=2962065 RepID=UPI0021F41110|nr:acetyltransferase [Pollutimonas sp. M17]UYO93998.1 acetyltransferase [Pollutimonas sp. M17]
MKRLAIVGAGGHGRVIADAAQCSGWQAIDFYDDAWPGTGPHAGPWPIAGDTSLLFAQFDNYQGVIVGIGNNPTRAAVQQRLIDAGASLASVVHPAAVVSRNAQLGAGCAVFAQAVVNVGARIGDGAILNTGCIIEHDCLIEDFVHIGPNAGLGGGVHIGQQSWVGIGASINHLIHIGRNSIIGSGATVIRDIPDAMVAVGTPARARPA